MKIQLYTESINDCSIKLLDTLLAVVPEEQIQFTISIEALRQSLLKSNTSLPVVVIHVSSLMNISELNNVKELLDNRFLVIVSESRDSQMVAKCRQLYPRLLSFSDENFGVIAAVIRKQLARLEESDEGSRKASETLVQRVGR